MKNFKTILSTVVLAGASTFAFAQCGPGETEVIVNMFDSFGDGWNGNTYTITDGSGGGSAVASGGLVGSVSSGSDTICLADDCYTITVGGGSFTGEVSWDLTVGGGIIDAGGAPETSFFTIGGGVCVIEGCTDPDAVNYNPDATVDDGSCISAASNDACDTAEEIECDDPLDGSTSDATPTVGAVFCGTTISSADVWYYWPGDGSLISVSVCNDANFDTKLNIYSGDCGSLTCVAGNDDGIGCSGFTSLISNVITDDGTDYYIRVGGFGSATGDFTLTVTCEELDPVEGDICDEAIEVECGDEFEGSTVDALPDGAPFCGVSNTANGVWGYFAGDGSYVTLNMDNSSYDTKLTVYEGDCGALVCVDGDDDGGAGLTSEVTFLSEDGVDYLILIHGFGSASGDFIMTIECEEIEVPENDEACDAEEIECGGAGEGETTFAGFDGAPFCGTSNTAAGIWYMFQGDGSCVIAGTAAGANGLQYDTKLTVYTGDCGDVAGLTCVDGDDDGGPGLLSEVGWTSVDGEDYLILVHGFGSSVGEFTLNVECFEPPANDNVCSAEGLSLDVASPWDNVCASAQAGEIGAPAGTGDGASCNTQNGWCSFALGVENSLWYTFEAPAGGCVSITTSGTADMQLAVYEAGDCADFSTFTLLAANDDSGLGLAPLIDQLSCLSPGATYYVQLDGFAGATANTESITVSDCGLAPLEASIDGCLNTAVGAGPLYQCTELSAVVSGGAAPYTITWDNGSTSESQVYCPDAATSVSFTVTDANGCSVTADATILATDLSCGSSSSSNSGSSNSGSGSGSSSGSSVAVSGSGSSSGSSVSCPSAKSECKLDGKVAMCDNKGKNKCVPAHQVEKNISKGYTLGSCGSDAVCNYGDNGLADDSCSCTGWIGAIRLQYAGPNGSTVVATNCGDTIYNSAAGVASCDLSIDMTDSFGDGWNGASLGVLVNGVAAQGSPFAATGTGSSASFSANSGDLLELTYSPGSFESENAYSVNGPTGVIFSDGPSPATGVVFSGAVDCNSSVSVNNGDIIDIYAADSARFADRYIIIEDGLGGCAKIDTKCPKVGSSSGSGSGSSMIEMIGSGSGSGNDANDIQGARIGLWDVIGYVDEEGNRCNMPLCEDLSLSVLTDQFSGETSFSLVDATDGVTLVEVVQGDGQLSPNTQFSADLGCVDPNHCYEFTINDSFGDGICCSFGDGNYTVTLGGNTVTSGWGAATGTGEGGDGTTGFAGLTSQTVQLGGCAAKAPVTNLGMVDGAAITAFPNPFSATTNIQFSLPEADVVEVAVYTLAGEKVDVLYNGKVAANTQMTVEFNGTDLSDGVYFYRLTTNTGVVQNGKMILQH